MIKPLDSHLHSFFAALSSRFVSTLLRTSIHHEQGSFVQSLDRIYADVGKGLHSDCSTRKPYSIRAQMVQFSFLSLATQNKLSSAQLRLGKQLTWPMLRRKKQVIGEGKVQKRQIERKREKDK